MNILIKALASVQKGKLDRPLIKKNAEILEAEEMLKEFREE